MTPVGVLCGGFSRQELREAGAAAVFATLDELRQAIDTLLPGR
jgi:phosphoglycolate phosphatase-like HAD superfamily hydrolase